MKLPVLALLCLAWAGVASASPSEVRREQLFMSEALGRPQTFDLYLPADRDGLTRLPVIYLLHGTESRGGDWLDKGDLKAVADRLMAAGTIPRAIIVMPDGGNSWYVDAPAPAGLGAMGTALERDLPDWIERNYPVRDSRDGRAIGGYSMGGFGALRFGLMRPGRYAAVAVMSGAFWTSLKPDSAIQGKMVEAVHRIFDGAFGDPFDPARFIAESPLTLAARLPGDAPRPDVLLICGRNEVFHMREEQEVVKQVLTAARVPFDAELTDGDHDWDNWRAMLPGVLTFLGKRLRPASETTTARR